MFRWCWSLCVSQSLVIATALAAAALSGGVLADETAPATQSVAPAPKLPPLPRIGVADGRFVMQQTGEVFRPRGMNYIRLRPTWHGTFSPKRYDARRAEAMLQDLAARQFNVVRVFVDPAPGEGIVESREAAGLSAAYMEHYCDFLARARAHGIYVVAALCGLPPCDRYDAGQPRRGFSFGNSMYLKPQGIAAKALFVSDFVTAIKQRDPDLLSTMFAYELDNETNFWAASDPFSKGEGTVEMAGQSYDMSSDVDIQRLADDAVVNWANACVDAIKAVDPHAMVNVNVFTFAAVGRSGPASLRKDQTKDRRFPARPLALTRSKLSYIDIHFYPFDDGTLEKDLKSIEFDQLKQACAERGMPMIMGEFGAFRKPYPTVQDAAAAMQQHLQRVYSLGFQGYIYWTYDTDEQEFLWNARSEDGTILDALMEVEQGELKRTAAGL